MNKKNIKFIILLLIIILLEIMIFYFSNMNTSESNSKSKLLMSKVINTTIIVTNKIGLLDEIPTKEEKQAIIEILNKPFRKCIHFSIYLILSILIINAINEKNNNYSKVLITIIICFLLALTDEYHQTFINGRTGSFKDVIIDIIGSITGIYIYKRKLKKKYYKNIYK